MSKETTSFKNTVISYFKGVRIEWGKITWPEKKHVVIETGYVLVICAFFTVMILLMDWIYKWAFSFLNLKA